MVWGAPPHFFNVQHLKNLLKNQVRTFINFFHATAWFHFFLKCFWNMPWELGLGLKCMKSCSPDLVFFYGNMNIEIWKMWIWGICRAIYTYFLQKHVKTWASSKSLFWLQIFRCPKLFFVFFGRGGAYGARREDSHFRMKK